MGKAVRRLDERYTAQSGRVFLTGLQALVRLPLMQRQRDRAAGLNTAGYISGYRGSPLGGYDAALQGAGHFLKAADVKFQPGVNEELAATAVWGTQQVGLWPNPKHDGVFAIWYGKGPGVDRCGDAFKHGNLAGSSQHGGVLLVDTEQGKGSVFTLWLPASLPLPSTEGVPRAADAQVVGAGAP